MYLLIDNVAVDTLVFVQPGFGASLHTLKVEIGGDAQSSGKIPRGPDSHQDVI